MMYHPGLLLLFVDTHVLVHMFQCEMLYVYSFADSLSSMTDDPGVTFRRTPFSEVSSEKK